jgi:hypothetical protein
MNRELHTAEEIRLEVARLLNEGRMNLIDVPEPMRLALKADRSATGGANWDLSDFRARQARGSEAAIARAIMAVKAKWDLR